MGADLFGPRLLSVVFVCVAKMALCGHRKNFFTPPNLIVACSDYAGSGSGGLILKTVISKQKPTVKI